MKNIYNSLKIEGPVFKYKGKTYTTQTCRSDNFQEYIDNLTENQSIAIYQINTDNEYGKTHTLIRFAILDD